MGYIERGDPLLDQPDKATSFVTSHFYLTTSCAAAGDFRERLPHFRRQTRTCDWPGLRGNPLRRGRPGRRPRGCLPLTSRACAVPVEGPQSSAAHSAARATFAKVVVTLQWDLRQATSYLRSWPGSPCFAALEPISHLPVSSLVPSQGTQSFVGYRRACLALAAATLSRVVLPVFSLPLSSVRSLKSIRQLDPGLP